MKQTKTSFRLTKELAKTQLIFNKWIRTRDRDRGCISCSTGQVEHAGHYFSMGHHKAYCFNEMNTNGQCLRCNNFLHGNLINYRKGLVHRYGEEKLLMLENAADLRKVKKWSEFELKALRELYKQY